MGFYRKIMGFYRYFMGKFIGKSIRDDNQWDKI